MKNSGERFRPIDLPAVSNHLQSFAPGRMMETCKQTDTPLETEDEGSQTSIAFRNKFELFKKSTESHVSLSQSLQLNAETSLTREPEDDKKAVLKEIQKRKEMEDSLNINISNVPDVNIKKEIISPSQVDLSGLELLSSSAEQLTCESKCKVINSDDKEAVRNSVIDAERKDLSNDACEGAVLLQNLKNGFRELDTSNGYESVNSKSLGGLGLLCALAEQRFQEEIHKEIYESEKTSLEEEEEQKEEKENKEEQNFNNENEAKESVVNQEVEDCESYKNYQDETDEYLPKQKRENEEVERIDNGSLENSPRNKKLRCDKVEEVSKENLITETPNQSEESQNSPSKRGPGRPKKIKCKKLVTKFSSCQRVNRNSKEMSPPILEKQTDYSYKKDEDFVKLKYKTDVLKPPTLTPSAILDPVCKTAPETLRLPPCEVTLTAVKIDHENVKRLMKSETVDSSESESKKRKMTDSNDQHSSSKKRKVGRPKKHHLLTGSKNPLTETIVAKKPKTKSNYVFPSAQSAENLVYPNAKSGEASPEKCVWNGDKRKSPFVKVDSDSVPSPDSPLNGDGKDGKSKKIRPKLKAEPKIKEWTPSVDDANAEWRKNGKTDENVSRKTKVSKKTSLSSKGQTERLEPGESKKPKLPSCVLTTEHIKSNKFPVRTLTAMGGLFYAGHLSAIRAPDVYGITIDGERGNRPHIYSREEILKDSVRLRIAARF